MKIGKAKFGGEYVKRKYWKLKDGESVFRILPPLGSLADSGKWSQFYNVHYGYKNSAGQMRVFQSPLVKNRKTRMVEVPDAALERIENLQAQQKKAKDAGDQKMADKLYDLLQTYNLDNNHYVNAMDQQGNIGILKLRHRAKLALDATIKRLREAGVEPLDADSGRFFVFRRSGTGLDTSFQVDILQERLKVEGVGVVNRDVVHTLTEEIITRLSKEAAELDKLYKRPTAEEVARIVKEGARAVDEILDTKANDGGTTNDDGGEEELGEDEGAADPQAAAAAAAAAAEAEVAAAKAKTEAAAKAAAVEAKVKADAAAKAAAEATAKASAAKTETLATPPKTTQAPAATDQSDEDFLKSLGL